MKITKIFWAFVSCMLMLSLASCESDDSITKEAPEEAYIQKAREILQGDIVLSTKATMNGVDKTHLPDGCPTKFNFTWKDEKNMVLKLTDFTVGSMPFAISFVCANKFMKLNSWEREEYTGEGWVKFLGKDGNVTNNTDNNDTQQGSGATVQGYMNVITNKVEFIIDYNMMNVRSECFLQEINKERIKNYEAEFAQFEKDLEKWKEEHPGQ